MIPLAQLSMDHLRWLPTFRAVRQETGTVRIFSVRRPTRSSSRVLHALDFFHFSGTSASVRANARRSEVLKSKPPLAPLLCRNGRRSWTRWAIDRPVTHPAPKRLPGRLFVNDEHERAALTAHCRFTTAFVGLCCQSWRTREPINGDCTISGRSLSAYAANGGA